MQRTRLVTFSVLLVAALSLLLAGPALAELPSLPCNVTIPDQEAQTIAWMANNLVKPAILYLTLNFVPPVQSPEQLASSSTTPSTIHGKATNTTAITTTTTTTTITTTTTTTTITPEQSQRLTRLQADTNLTEWVYTESQSLLGLSQWNTLSVMSMTLLTQSSTFYEVHIGNAECLLQLNSTEDRLHALTNALFPLLLSVKTTSEQLLLCRGLNLAEGTMVDMLPSPSCEHSGLRCCSWDSNNHFVGCSQALGPNKKFERGILFMLVSFEFLLFLVITRMAIWFRFGPGSMSEDCESKPLMYQLTTAYTRITPSEHTLLGTSAMRFLLRQTKFSSHGLGVVAIVVELAILGVLMIVDHTTLHSAPFPVRTCAADRLAPEIGICFLIAVGAVELTLVVTRRLRLGQVGDQLLANLTLTKTLLLGLTLALNATFVFVMIQFVVYVILSVLLFPQTPMIVLGVIFGFMSAILQNWDSWILIRLFRSMQMCDPKHRLHRVVLHPAGQNCTCSVPQAQHFLYYLKTEHHIDLQRHFLGFHRGKWMMILSKSMASILLLIGVVLVLASVNPMSSLPQVFLPVFSFFSSQSVFNYISASEFKIETKDYAPHLRRWLNEKGNEVSTSLVNNSSNSSGGGDDDDDDRLIRS